MNYSELYSAFPKRLEMDVRAVLSALQSEVNGSLDERITYDTATLIHGNVQEIILDGERIFIPGRVYFKVPIAGKMDALSDVQNAILNCIYSRHHDGYVRQRMLNNLRSNSHYFIIPYIFQLLGEYILNILIDLDTFINEKNIDLFRQFMSDNPGYCSLTRSRMISYWNEYYRFGENKDLRNYIGAKIFERLVNG